MPQIMETGLVTSAVASVYPGILTQTSEVLFDDLDRHGSASPQDEERRIRMLRVTGLWSLREVLSHHLIEVRPQRNESRFIEFGVADGQHGIGQIYIPESQSDGFAHAEASAV
jgi:hypothetical protein